LLVTRGAGIAVVVASLGLLTACSSPGSAWSSVATSSTPSGGVLDSLPSSSVPTSTFPAAPAGRTSSAAPADSTPVATDSTPVATDSPRPQTTDVVLSFIGWDPKTAAVEAGGYLSPLVESGGTCTLELTKAGRTVSHSSRAEPDATTTACGNLAVPRGKLTPGSWRAVLRYTSPRTTGTSAPTTVEVPQ
jgi:hypothetical protein